MLACVGTVGLTAAGCSNQATSAATVGGVAIAESAIFERTSALADQVEQAGGAALDPATVATVNRAQTTFAIRSQLLETAAADNGVVITDEQVNAAIAGGSASDAANQLGTPPDLIEQTVRDLLILEGLSATEPAAGAPITNVSVTIDGVSVADRDAAVATRSDFLADPAAVDATIAASAQPLTTQTVSLLTNPSVAATGVYAAKDGDVLLYPSQNGYFVVRVLDRVEEPAVLTPADLSQQELAGKFDLGALLLAPYAEAAGVSVNPRLGQWDPLTLQVVPGGSGL